MYEVGVGKSIITAYKPNVGMMGYGMFHNRLNGVETELHARAFVFKDLSSNKKLVLVNAEIAFITISIKRGVMKRLNRHHAELGYTPDNVLLSAQHTHSGPAGYSHYGLYNIVTPGFVPEVYQTIVDGIVEAIIQAEQSLKPANITMNKGSFDMSVDIGINRSVNAYNQNPEVQPKLTEAQANEAFDREMTLFRVDATDGKPIGAFNFFGLHCTSVHNDNTKVNFDNKGYAAQFHEEELKAQNPDFISVFAQNVAGDITPNQYWDKKKKWTRGKFEDDIESAKYTGKQQYHKAKEIFDAAPDNGQTINMGIDHVMSYVNFADVKPHTDFTNGAHDAYTSPSCHGVAFMKGTKEGPGMDAFGAAAATAASAAVKFYEYIGLPFRKPEEKRRILRKYKAQGNKAIVIESGERKLLGTHNVKALIVPAFIDPTVKYFKLFHKGGGLDHKPWTPQTLPLQIVTLGQIAFATIPGEITTIAGERLKATIHNELKENGIQEVILVSYANAYMGYITTYEEYQVQAYEGGHTVFGEWTLAAFQTKYRELAKEMLKPHGERMSDKTVRPVKFTQEELNKRIFAYKK